MIPSFRLDPDRAEGSASTSNRFPSPSLVTLPIATANDRPPSGSTIAGSGPDPESRTRLESSGGVDETVLPEQPLFLPPPSLR